MTNASSATAYATAAQMIVRYDVRLLGDLCGDAGARVSAGSLTIDANLAAALSDASGEVEAAALRGARYAAADLAALSGMAAARLVRLTCRIAMALLLERRTPSADPPKWWAAVVEELDRLSAGERIFGTQEAMDAGSGLEQIAAPDAEPGPRPAMSDTARRFFGFRGRTYPPA